MAIWLNIRRAALAAVTATAAFAAPAQAQIVKSGDFTLTGSIGATTDYIFRGISQNRRDVAGQGTLDATYKYFYVGMFLATVDFANDQSGTVTLGNGKNIANLEIDFYAGFKYPVSKMIDVDVGVIYYVYPGGFDGPGAANRELDYVEGKFAITLKPIDPLAVTGTVYYSPEYTNDTGSVVTLEAGATYTLPTWSKIGTAVSGLLGYQTGDDARFKSIIANGDSSYLYWNAGATFTFEERLSLDFRYWGTDIKDNNAAGGFADRFCSGSVFQCTDAFSATAKVTF